MHSAAAIDPSQLAMNESEEAEHRLSLRQADAARADLYAIHDELDFIKTQISRLPTRKDLARIALLSLLGGVALAIAGLEARPALSLTAEGENRPPAAFSRSSLQRSWLRPSSLCVSGVSAPLPRWRASRSWIVEIHRRERQERSRG
jgi:hypothetical protein